MGTRFEILLYGEDEIHLRGAAEEALDEIEKLEALISAFRTDSCIHRINTLAADSPIRMPPAVFTLLLKCRRLWEATHGRFDPTIGPLMHCLGFRGETAPPGEDALRSAREAVGMNLVELNETDLTVSILHPRTRLDLGAIGKGWAIDQAVQLLRENDVASALIHGGTSTAFGIGAPPEEKTWAVALRPPPAELLEFDETRSPLPVIHLRDSAMAVSGLAGRMITTGAAVEGHILDPLAGRPVRHSLLTAVAAETAAAADAWSTALLAGGESFFSETPPAAGVTLALLLTREGKVCLKQV